MQDATIDGSEMVGAKQTAPAAQETAVSDELSSRAQAMRGLACLLLVSFHVIVDNSINGLDEAGTSVFVKGARVLAPLRMPLFMFLAGFVYAYRPIRAGGHRTFIRKKLWRLAVPFVFVSTLFFAFQYATGEPVALRRIWRVYAFTYAHFWFMQSLMIILTLIVVLERTRALSDMRRFATAFLLALLAHFLVVFDPNPFSINQALYLLPFFLLGIGANRFRQAWSPRWVKAVTVSVFTACALLHVLACFDIYGPTQGPRSLLWTSISITGTLMLLWWMPSLSWLQALGAFSFAIYMHHVFFTTGTRLMLGTFGIDSGRMTYFLAALVFGIAGPILLEKALGRYDLARRLLLGRG
jgi:glucan biosynthesis protein C